MTGLNGVLQAVGSAGMSGPIQTAPAGGAPGGMAPFGGLVSSLVGESASLSKKAEDAVTGVLNGSGVEVHDAMIATEKADMAFELGLQMRNKAVAAYQQMMNMQF